MVRLLVGAMSARANTWPLSEKHLSMHRSANGLTFLIYERPTAPVVSFYTYVNVGAAQEVPGITGLAHMFEHMAFKGTQVVGTSDYAAEKAALDKIDQAYKAYDLERRRVGKPDAEKLQALQKRGRRPRRRPRNSW